MAPPRADPTVSVLRVRSTRPGPLTLVAFAFVVIVGGSNFVAVRLSNRELPPFYGAGVRFALSSVLLMGVGVLGRMAVPRGRALVGAVIFGVLNFFAGYAFFYWGLQEVPAALGGVVFGTVPLLTFALAVAQRQERFRWRGVGGAAIAIGGVIVMVGGPGSADAPFVYVAAVIMSAIGAAEAAIVVKHFPDVHPIPLNAVAMTVGTILLLALSAISGERWSVPDQVTTQWALAYLATIGSVGLFIGYVYVVQTWTASGASYQFVLFPVVTALTGALIADEMLSATIAIGGVLAVLGTYVGALAGAKEPQVVPSEPVG
jgi:drug/metabolite transporter (DMT)-like permease